MMTQILRQNKSQKFNLHVRVSRNKIQFYNSSLIMIIKRCSHHLNQLMTITYMEKHQEKESPSFRLTYASFYLIVRNLTSKRVNLLKEKLLMTA